MCVLRCVHGDVYILGMCAYTKVCVFVLKCVYVYTYSGEVCTSGNSVSVCLQTSTRVTHVLHKGAAKPGYTVAGYQ